MTVQDTASGFGAVDRAAEPGAFVGYLDTVSALRAAQAYKQQTFALLGLREGHRVLDVGCGTGDDARALARAVGHGGRVVGVDSSGTMISEARRRSEGLDLPVEYLVADAHRLGFPEGVFDGCRADRIFQHLEDPAKALTEMIRVVRPGGRVVVCDPDWESLVIDSPDRSVTRRIVRFLCDSCRNGRMGRQLFALFKQSVVTDVVVVPFTAVLPNYPIASAVLGLETTAERARSDGVLSSGEASRWLADLEQASRAGRFFGALTGFIAAGRKP